MRCPIPACKGQHGYFMCVAHWTMLPKALRDWLEGYHAREAEGYGFKRVREMCISFIVAQREPTASAAWHPVAGFKGLYEVSDRGHVRDLKTGKLRRWEVNSVGYPQMKLKDLHGQPHWRLVHVMVAEAHIGRKPSAHEIDHVDGNIMRPHVANLEYVTKSEQMQRARKVGWHHVKLSPEERQSIAKSNHTVRYLAGLYDASPTVVRRLRNDRRAA